MAALGILARPFGYAAFNFARGRVEALFGDDYAAGKFGFGVLLTASGMTMP